MVTKKNALKLTIGELLDALRDGRIGESEGIVLSNKAFEGTGVRHIMIISQSLADDMDDSFDFEDWDGDDVEIDYEH